MRGRGVEAGSRLAAETGVRLQRLSQQWRPVPVDAFRPPPDDDPRPPDDPWRLVLDDAGPDPSTSPGRAGRDVDADSRIALGPWNRSALRGLVALVCTALVITGWWWWSGRPRAVAAAPTIVATGAPLPGLAASPVAAMPAAASPVAASSAASSLAASPVAAASVAASSVATAPAAASGVAVPQVVVHVIGFIGHPGVVTLPVGSRVADAVAAAGGVTRRRAADSVNLARVLVDGEQIVIGPSARPQSATAARASAPAGGSSPAGGSPPAGGASSAGSALSSGGAANPMDINTADAATLELLPGVGPVLADRIVMWRTSNGPFRSVEELGEVSGIGDSILAQVRPLVRV